MTVTPRTILDLQRLHEEIKRFLISFEKLYVAGDSAKVNRCRLCIFQLIHVPQHIQWNESIRIDLQVTTERIIEELGHKVHSRRAPFANLANIVFEK